MNLLKKSSYLLLILALVVGGLSACKNEDEPDAVLTVTSVAPLSGIVGSEVTITGTKFDATLANNVVKFGTVTAELVSGTTTELKVKVPAGAGNGPVSVTTSEGTISSTQSFSISARPIVVVQGNITSNTTWTSDKIYHLKGFVYVTEGNTLTIEKGTIIKGGTKDEDPSGQQLGGTLIVRQGAKISAIGTVTEPIVFTSSKAIGQRFYGDWGGIVLIGKAPHNRPAATTFEGGITGTFGTFSDAADNSGSLQYVRIEFAGIALTNQSNSEINGLTLYGVGTGTTIDHVQVSYSGDDSFEWFGGTVNAKHLIAYRGWDDDWDTDWGFTGKIQYALSLRDPEFADQSGSNGFESDNFNSGEPATGANVGMPLTAPLFANVSNLVTTGTPSSATKQGNGGYQSAMHLRRNTSISIFNSLFVGYPEGLRLDGTATGTLNNATTGALDLRGIVLSNIPEATRVIGRGDITNAQAQTYFNAAERSNSYSELTALLLNSANFTLTNPTFLPQAGSPLLTGAVWTGKAADAYFTKETFRGAFGTVDWTKGWANWDPQNTDYDK